MFSVMVSFVLMVRAPDLMALRDLVLLKLHDMPEVRTTQTMLLLDEVQPSQADLLAEAGG